MGFVSVKTLVRYRSVLVFMSTLLDSQQRTMRPFDPVLTSSHTKTHREKLYNPPKKKKKKSVSFNLLVSPTTTTTSGAMFLLLSARALVHNEKSQNVWPST